MSQPAVPLRVVWEGIANPQLYEDMVSCLLSILHPNSVRTDASEPRLSFRAYCYNAAVRTLGCESGMSPP